MAKPGFKLALFTTFFALLVVVVGAYTRLVDAGLGCPDWPGCYGHFSVPTSEGQLSKAKELYPEEIVEAAKAWPEMIHRYLASILGLLIIGLALISWRHRDQKQQPVKLPLFLVILVMIQGAFGAWTVTLKLWPQVVTAHLFGGFTTLTLLALLTLRLAPWRAPPLGLMDRAKALYPWCLAGLVVLIGQIVLGGWVSSNYAALACPDLPFCQGQLLPNADFSQGFNVLQSIGPNYLGGQLNSEARTAIHLAHRIGAIVVSIALLLVFVVLNRLGKNNHLGVLAKLMLGLLMVQISLGLSNIIWYIPLGVAVAHNAGAALLTISMVTILYYLKKESQVAKTHAVSAQPQSLVGGQYVNSIS